jgi:hypothetical protein
MPHGTPQAAGFCSGSPRAGVGDWLRRNGAVLSLSKGEAGAEVPVPAFREPRSRPSSSSNNGYRHLVPAAQGLRSQSPWLTVPTGRSHHANATPRSTWLLRFAAHATRNATVALPGLVVQYGLFRWGENQGRQDHAQEAASDCASPSDDGDRLLRPEGQVDSYESCRDMPSRRPLPLGGQRGRRGLSQIAASQALQRRSLGGRRQVRREYKDRRLRLQTRLV